MATIYNAPTSLNTHLKPGQATYDGAGVTIGIATDGGVNIPDVQNYRSLFKLPATQISVVMDGNSPGSGNDTESTLDAEVAGAIAPGAQITYYQAADTTFQSGVMLAILRAIDDNAVNILNVSYGTCELSQGAAGNQAILNAWEQAAAQGIAVTVSSGDSGSAGCDNADTQTAASRGFGVNALASTPYTVAVGGTDFDVLLNHFSTYVNATNSGNYTSALSYIPEATWNNSPASNGSAANNQANVDYSGNTNIAAGGGGASSAGLYDGAGNVLSGYAKPQWQQQYEASAGIAADKVRDIPDVSLFAANGMYGALWATCGDKRLHRRESDDHRDWGHLRIRSCICRCARADQSEDRSNGAPGAAELDSVSTGEDASGGISPDRGRKQLGGLRAGHTELRSQWVYEGLRCDGLLQPCDGVGKRGHQQPGE